MLTTIGDVRDRLYLDELEDSEILSHLQRADRDFRGVVFDDSDDNFDEKEAVSCKAIYYLAPLLWQRIQQKVNEYDETLQTFTDVEKFQEYWLDRAMSVPSKKEDGSVVKVGIRWAAV